MYKSILLLFTIALFMTGCQENANEPNTDENPTTTLEEASPNEEPSPNEEATPAKEVSSNSLISIVDNLRLRDVPDAKKGKIVGEIKYGDKAEYLGEDSDFKEKIELRGKMRYDAWKKVKFKDKATSKEIVGWVYGGGLMKESDIYKVASGGNYEREIIRATEKEFGNIIDLEIEMEFFYDGVVRYKKEANGNFVKHGKFKVVGRRPSDYPDVDLVYTITGNFENGLAEGLFEADFQGGESADIATVNFERGKCISSSYAGSAEGEDYNHRESNPKECTFKFIKEALYKAKGWK